MGPIEDIKEMQQQMDIDEAVKRYKYASKEYRRAHEEYVAASDRLEAADLAVTERREERYVARQALINIAEAE